VQTITSAATSLNQVPALFKKLEWEKGTWNLDIGGGKYDLASRFLQGLGVKNLIFDPFNRSKEYNLTTLRALHGLGADTVTLANVLNVIKDYEDRHEALFIAKTYVKPGGSVYISCYRGKGNTPGPTSKGWQENRPLLTYLDEVEKVFPTAYCGPNYIRAYNI